MDVILVVYKETKEADVFSRMGRCRTEYKYVMIDQVTKSDSQIPVVVPVCIEKK